MTRGAVRCAACYGRGRGATRTRRLDSNGYVLLWMPSHPAALNGRVREHRAIMELSLDRPLWPGETVHHRNGKRDDNRRGNLELWVTLQPRGQRPADLVRFAYEILRRYDPDCRPDRLRGRRSRPLRVRPA